MFLSMSLTTREHVALTGFDGVTTMTIGTIKMAVCAGGITKIVKFVVIDKSWGRPGSSLSERCHRPIISASNSRPQQESTQSEDARGLHACASSPSRNCDGYPVASLT
ncbi:unnamed protein product [Arabis nemorensis]|uniref:Uncharacterized protein n=1 Tax=Arabis nemorensis TaxID=586526 RepID=A0A565AUW5_9BRAS|nr:unnamed protein product [Arabis nemorensis]